MKTAHYPEARKAAHLLPLLDQEFDSEFDLNDALSDHSEELFHFGELYEEH